jgi:hypothetical protein
LDFQLISLHYRHQLKISTKILIPVYKRGIPVPIQV